MDVRPFHLINPDIDNCHAVIKYKVNVRQLNNCIGIFFCSTCSMAHVPKHMTNEEVANQFKPINSSTK